jgi:hypothetical protein
MIKVTFDTHTFDKATAPGLREAQIQTSPVFEVSSQMSEAIAGKTAPTFVIQATSHTIMFFYSFEVFLRRSLANNKPNPGNSALA